MNLDRDKLFQLFSALSDGTLGALEHRQLQDALRGSAGARRQWFLFNDIELGLAGTPAAHGAAPPAVSAGRWWWSAAAAAAAAVLVAAVWLAGPHRAAAPFAALAAATNARWSDPNVELTLRGGELPPGALQLEAGVAEFAFAGGATAVIEGPAVFEPIAADRLLLRSGRALGRCGNAAAKLIIVTPNAVVTDLGTEFGVTVGADQQTRVAVLKGAVELDAGKHPQRLSAGEAVTVDAHGRTVPADFVIAEFSKMATLLPAEEVGEPEGGNLLRNPGLMGAAQAWNGTAGHVDRNAEGRARIRANGSHLWPLLWQEVPTGDIAGKVVVASVCALQPAADPLQGNQNAIVKVVFLDAEGRQFAQAERHFLRSSAPRDRWVRGQIAALAPAGSVRVQFQILLNARGLQTGAVLFDDPALFIAEPRKARP